MWIVLGNRFRTTRAGAGASLERRCGHCGKRARFDERTISAELRSEFAPLLLPGRHRVLACAACGAHHATDELGPPGEPLAEGTARPARGLFGALRAALTSARRGTAVDDHAPLAPPPATTPAADAAAGEADPFADEEQQLAARFAALEAKLGRNRSTQKPLK